MILCSLLSFILFGCGGGSGGEKKPTILPFAYNVTIDGNTRIGELVRGQYEFEANDKSESDASTTYWLKGDGTKISDGDRLLLDDTSLEGGEVKFCVLPINAGNRLKGDLVCSQSAYVDSRVIIHIPTVSFLFVSEASRVGHELTVLVDGSIQELTYHWYKDDVQIPDIRVGTLALTKKYEGLRIHVCTTYDSSSNDKSCSEKTAPIRAAMGSAPTVDSLSLNFGADEIKVGETITVEAVYIDIDDDKEDSVRRQYRWYSKESIVGNAKSLLVSPQVVNQSIKACVTVYAKTGSPKASEQTCSKDVYVIEKDPVAPIVSGVSIRGINIEGYRLKGEYRYFDGNNDTEGKSLLEWKLDADHSPALTEGDTIRLSASIVEQASLINKATPSIYFCVTPYDELGTKGKTACEAQRLATISFKGSLTPGGELAIENFYYPEFTQSWWQAKGSEFQYSMSFKSNFFNSWKGSVFYDSIVFTRYRPVQFCVKATDIDGDEQDICKEVTYDEKYENVSGAPLGGNKVAFEPMKEYNVDVDGNKYRLYRPILASEFTIISGGEFLSAESVIYDTFLGKETDAARGIKLTPNEAIKYCQRTSGGVVPNKVLKAAFFSNSEDSIIRNWSSFESAEWLVISERGKPVEYGTWAADAFEETPIEADPNKTYRFICHHKLGAQL